MTDPTSPGFDPTPAGPPQYPAAPPTAPLPPPVGQWTTGSPTGSPTPAGAIELDPQQGNGGGRGLRPKVLVAVAAVAVLAGGTFASSQLLNDERGSGSPQEAAERLLAAVDQSDILGVIDLLPPAEQQLLLDITGELTDAGDRLGLVGDTFRLDGFPGVDIEVTDPEFETEELGEGLARVSLVAGEARVEIDGEELAGSLGEVVGEIVDANDGDLAVGDSDEEVDIAEVVEEAREEADDFDGEVANPFTVVAIEQDGRWFPSVGFTIAELARIDEGRFGDGPRAPDLDDGVEPDGAGSPEDAVQALLDAATGADGEEALAVLDPGEMGALQVYSEVFFGDLDEGDDTGVTVELTDAEVTEVGDGVHRVVPSGLVAAGDLDEGSFELVLEDGCISVVTEADDPDVEDLDMELCGGDDLAEALPDVLGDSFEDIEVPDELTELIEAFQPVEVGIITVEHDGEHFVSPLRTLFDVVAVSFRGLERDDLEEGGIVFELLTGGLDDEFEEFFDQIGDEIDAQFGEDFDGFDDDDDFDDDVDEDIDEPTPTRVPTGAVGSGPAGELRPGDVVAGVLQSEGTVTFDLIAAEGPGFIGAQDTDGADLTITVIDAATGEEVDFNDDFDGLDPEVLLLDLVEGQVLTVVVGEFGSGGGGFVVYYET